MSSISKSPKALPLAGVCVYTIVSPEKLIESVRDHKPLHEEKRWVSAIQHLKQARVEGTRVPIIFADARKCTKLIAWSTLDDVVVNGSTDFSISKLYDVGSATRGSLRVLATRAPIPISHRRPYVICETPEFLISLARRPKALSRSKQRLHEQPLSTSKAVNYWVVKGRPAENDFDRLKPGVRVTWRTGRPPKNWAIGDRLFFWRTTPSLDVVGIGEFLGLRSSGGPGGESLFNVRYLSPMLSAPVGIQELRKDPTFRDALFLKAGPAGTVFPLTVEQGERIYGLVAWQNPFVLGVWPDVREVSRGADVLPDLDILGTSGTEGRRRLVSHLRLERDRGVVEAKKRTVLKANGNLACEVCMFDFVKHYGRLGEGFCEVHHRKMLSKTVGERVTNLKDLAVVCSNCHRMLHRGTTLISIEKLRLTLNSA